MKTYISLRSESGTITLRSIAIKPMPNNAGFLISGNDRTVDKPLAAFSTAQEVLVYIGGVLLPEKEITVSDKIDKEDSDTLPMPKKGTVRVLAEGEEKDSLPRKVGSKIAIAKACDDDDDDYED